MQSGSVNTDEEVRELRKIFSGQSSYKFCHGIYIRNDPITTIHNHKDLGMIISSNLNWNLHHGAILRKPYRTLGLVRRTFSATIPSSAKVKLYISIIRSQLLYCSPVWRPHLIKDIKKLEQLQHRATKYILNDYTYPTTRLI